jgi:hypothetical protein
VVSSNFKKAFRGIDSAIQQGTARALNRALSSTKTKVTRQLREETALKTDIITARLRAKKAKANQLGAILAIAVKFDVPLTKFSPKAKSVKVGKRRYDGVTVKVGKQPRQLAPKAFFLQGKSVDGVVIARKGEAKNPLIQPKSDAFRKSAQAAQEPATKHMADTFEKNVGHEIEFAVSRKFKQNK